MKREGSGLDTVKNLLDKPPPREVHEDTAIDFTTLHKQPKISEVCGIHSLGTGCGLKAEALSRLWLSFRSAPWDSGTQADVTRSSRIFLRAKPREER